jgi:hypothetical protein
MTAALEEAIQNLEAHGWRCCRHTGPQAPLPPSLIDRYPWIPTDVMSALCELDEVVRQNETVWLLTAKDYAGQSDSAFAWNEFELQSLEAAEGDQKWLEEIRAFWNDHFPIALSVRGGYAYWALKKDATVVNGREPEYEQTSTFAASFRQFLSRLPETLERNNGFPPPAP